MVIDTSAFLAIVQDEPDRRSFTEAIGAAVVRRTSGATFLEASMVLQSRYGAEGIQRLARRHRIATGCGVVGQVPDSLPPVSRRRQSEEPATNFCTRPLSCAANTSPSCETVIP